MELQVRSIVDRLIAGEVADVHMLGRFRTMRRPAHGETPPRTLAVLQVSPWLRNELNPGDRRPVPVLKPSDLAAPDIVSAVLEGLSAGRAVDIEGLGQFRMSTRNTGSGAVMLPVFHMGDPLFCTLNPGLTPEDRLG